MGATQSTSLQRIINQSIVDVPITIKANTSSSVSGTQNVTISGSLIDSTISQDASLTLDSIQNIKIDMDMIKAIVSKVKAEAKADGDLGAYTSSKSETELINIFETRIPVNILSSCAASVNLTQNVNLLEGSVVVGSQINQVGANLSKCGQIVDIATQITDDITGDVDSISIAETKGLTSLTTAFMDGITGPFKWIAIGFVGFFLLLIVIALVMTFGSDDDQPQFNPYAQPQYQPQFNQYSQPPFNQYSQPQVNPYSQQPIFQPLY